MEDYINKAKILTRFFGVYGCMSGNGNFDLSLEEVARIIELICTKSHDDFLEINLKEMYERLYKIRS